MLRKGISCILAISEAISPVSIYQLPSLPNDPLCRKEVLCTGARCGDGAQNMSRNPIIFLKILKNVTTYFLSV
jgi:hypothetical protein